MFVSICIPAYKNVFFLKRCLDSIFLQTFQDYEIIITDDSPDESIESLLLEYNDNRIRYVKNKESLGSPLNWNKAISEARGEFVKIMHHDDWFSSSDSLYSFVRASIEYPNVDFIFSACDDVTLDGKKKEHLLSEDSIVRIRHSNNDLFLGNIIGAPSVIMFRNGFNLVFDERLIWLVDLDFYIRFLEKSGFVYIREKLINIGISDNQITNYCVLNGELIVYEYLYLYLKFNLGKRIKYSIYIVRELSKYNVDIKKESQNLFFKTGYKVPRILLLFLYIGNRLYRPLLKLKSKLR